MRFTGKDVFHRHEFARELAADVGTVARDASEARWTLRQLAALLAEPVPLFIEDDDLSGVGACVVCGRRGALGRCPTCGLLVHYSCAPPELPGRPLTCPRYATAEAAAASGAEAPETTGSWDIEQPASSRVPCWPSGRG